MIKKVDKNKARIKRHGRIRNHISGTAECPRLAVYKSNKYVYAQLIDDVNGNTLVQASSLEKDIAGNVKSTSTVDAAKIVGKTIAERANSNNIKSVVFDRSGYVYHGKIKALADAARENGLDF